MSSGLLLSIHSRTVGPLPYGPVHFGPSQVILIIASTVVLISSGNLWATPSCSTNTVRLISTAIENSFHLFQRLFLLGMNTATRTMQGLCQLPLSSPVKEYSLDYKLFFAF